MTTFDPYYKWLGIHPSEQPANHYRLLGLQAFESNGDVIANAADLRQSHIRQFERGDHAEVAGQIQAELRQAAECLLNAQTKNEYDRELKSRARPTATASAAPAVPPVAPSPVPPAMAMPTHVQHPTSAPAVASPPEPEPITVPVVPAKRRSKPRDRSKQTLLIAAVGLILFAGLCGIAFVLQSGEPKDTDEKSTTKKKERTPKSKVVNKKVPSKISQKANSNTKKRNEDSSDGDTRNASKKPSAPNQTDSIAGTGPGPSGDTSPRAETKTEPPQPLVLTTIPASQRRIPRVTKRGKIVFENTEGLLGVGQDFTVEAIMSVQTNRGGGQVLGVGSRRSGFQWSLVLGQSRNSYLVLVYGGEDGKSKASKERPPFDNDGSPKHFVIQRLATTMQIFVDGKKLLEQEVLRREGSDANNLIVGSGFPLHNVCDVHEVRVSRTVRYKDEFEPPASLSSDSDTLTHVLFDRESEQAVDRSGHQRDAKLHNVEWIPFSQSGSN